MLAKGRARDARRIFLLGILGVTLPAVAQLAASDWITAGGYAEFHVVIPEQASETLLYAAEMFVKYWKACTGHEIEVSAVNEGRVNVWLGQEVMTPDLLPQEELDGLGEEEGLVRSFEPPPRAKKQGAAKQLLIAGATDQGTLDAVFEFFERFMRVRWLAPGVVHTPHARFTMPQMDHRFRPCFAYRFLGAGPGLEVQALEFWRAHRFREHPMQPILTRLATTHTHKGPGQGTRQAQPGRWLLCGRRPEVAETLWAKLEASIRASHSHSNPAAAERAQRLGWDAVAGLWSASLLEGAIPCSCPACQELAAREDSPMAPLLSLANTIGEKLDQAFPERSYRVHVLACGPRRAPPKTLPPRDSVMIQICTDGCDPSCPLDNPDSAVNAAFVADLKGWANKTKHLWIWDPAAHYDMLAPARMAQVIQSNLQLFDQYGAEGVCAWVSDLAHPAPSQPAALRNYLLARLLWNPDARTDWLVNEFQQHYKTPEASAAAKP